MQHPWRRARVRVRVRESNCPKAILAIENTNKYVAINMQLMYNFAESYEN